MFGERISIQTTLELQSDLHIGGQQLLSSESESNRTSKSKNNRAEICRDHENNPVIPSTSLKGVILHEMRSVCGQDELDYLFGSISEHKQMQGNIGALWFSPATFISPPAAGPEGSPASDISKLENGIHVAKHTSIDPKTGSAASNQLFEREIIPGGTTFEFNFECFTDAGPESQKMLARILATLEHGVKAGSQTRAGLGLIKLTQIDNVFEHKANPKTGKISVCENRKLAAKLADLASKVLPPVPKTKTVVLKLECDGPFISIGGQETRDGDHKVTTALSRYQNPELRPQSLLGVLRDRGRWLAEIDLAKKGEKNKFCRKRAAEWVSDNPKISLADYSQIDVLSSVERLFGCAGWAKRVSVESLTLVNKAAPKSLTSVSIDQIGRAHV